MSQGKSVVITVDPQANISIEAVGYKGTECQDATDWVEKALGKVEKTVPTADMYASENHEVEQIRIDGGG